MEDIALRKGYFDEELKIKHEPEETIIDVWEAGEPEQDSLQISETEPEPEESDALLDEKQTCKFCGKKYRKTYLKRHEDEFCTFFDPRKKEFCQVCKRFVMHLKRHTKLSHSYVIQKCELCDFTTKYDGNLAAHKNGVHLNIKSYKCKHCNKTFNHPSNRNKHVRKVHENTTFFNCQVCPNSVAFTRKDNLNLHMRRVHGFKMGLMSLLHCDLCASTFINKKSIERHMRMAHKGIQTTFKCKLCNKKFLIKKSLVDHLYSIHLKKFVCRFCNKVLGREHTLKIHEEKCR